MLVLLYFDWFGTPNELKEFTRKMKEAVSAVGGVHYRGRYAPDNRKFHFVDLFEAESYEKLLGALTSPKAPHRDYAKLTHGMFEILRGPLE